MILYGAGGHAKVIMDALRSCNKKVTAIFDDNPALKEWQGLIVDHDYTLGKYQNHQMIIAIGDIALRKQVSEKVKHQFGWVVHADAYLAPDAKIGTGTVVMNRAIVHPGAEIGRHVIVNTGAIVEHDSRIGDFSHIGPGAVLCGHVQIADEVLIGANATILPGVKIGSGVVVGAGAVVNSDVEARAVMVGNPAKKIVQNP